MKIVRIITGVLMLIFGLLGILAGIVSIVDPIGTQMADDHNPFGKPLVLTESILITAFYVLVLLTGVLLLIWPKVKTRFNQSPDTDDKRED
jgi:hypothetical protein